MLTAILNQYPLYSSDAHVQGCTFPLICNRIDERSRFLLPKISRTGCSMKSV